MTNFTLGPQFKLVSAIVGVTVLNSLTCLINFNHCNQHPIYIIKCAAVDYDKDIQIVTQCKHKLKYFHFLCLYNSTPVKRGFELDHFAL